MSIWVVLAVVLIAVGVLVLWKPFRRKKRRAVRLIVELKPVPKRKEEEE